ncbi:MAG: GNAT family N-acetyltransferase [Clostridiales bacterium]|nr:GNAT family N-acetyltransferase [Clostridiales bacterium]
MENNWNISPACPEQAEEIDRIVSSTIKDVYPKYYRDEVVDFFLKLHCLENIRKDIAAGNTYVIGRDGRILGTGTIDGNHINRVYVLPECQGTGIGSAMMTFLEREIIKEYDHTEVDASLPAGEFYRRRGYVQVEHREHHLAGGKILSYEIMRKAAP